MQELGSTIDSMSLQEALSSVAAAKAEIAKLTAAAEAARSSYTSCQQSVAESESKQQATGNEYGEQSFWEKRYQASVDTADMPLSSSSCARLYEWYLSYDRLRPLLLPSLESLECHGGSDRILVAGCGNSSLCEDLAADGCAGVVGCAVIIDIHLIS